ncbi:hypothetical protein WR25_00965 [Diploscapter pachys]|uniref:Uncharacterized protein n=1 Tax=Diploscapter pachys TaxID=2018661 RepID=A0A2A2JVS7_9BILA|nr:hypothetical protein WR25_00965 [Diploscapter pachys]
MALANRTMSLAIDHELELSVSRRRRAACCKVEEQIDLFENDQYFLARLTVLHRLQDYQCENSEIPLKELLEKMMDEDLAIPLQTVQSTRSRHVHEQTLHSQSQTVVRADHFK